MISERHVRFNENLEHLGLTKVYRKTYCFLKLKAKMKFEKLFP